MRTSYDLVRLARITFCSRKLLGQPSWTAVWAIKNSQITASSEANTNLAAWLARLHNVPKGGRKGAWCSRYNNYNQWIQVDFRKAMILTGIAIQGRQDYSQWMTAFYVRYSMDGVYFSEIKNWWNAYVKV